MAIKEQLPTSEVQRLTTNFVNKITNGQVKEAQDLGSQYIRERMREVGFLSHILPRENVMSSQLDRDENSELPKIVVDKEPESKAAYMPFRANAENHYFSSPRFSIFFTKVESQHFTKSILELQTYRADIRQILKDNSAKDIQEQEDAYFLDGIDAAIAASPANPIQDLAISGGLTTTSVKIALQALTQLQRKVGKILMSEALYLDTLDFSQNDVGFNLKEQWYKTGTEAPKGVFGVPTITTIKNNILPDNVFYVFATPEYLGKFYSILDPTLFVKQEADMIDFWTYECVGVGIGNVQSIIRVTL